MSEKIIRKMNFQEHKQYIILHRKTKRELVEMILFSINNTRVKRESLMMIRYDLNKVTIMVDSSIALPNSEKQEIIDKLNEVENILKFNVNELDKEEKEND